MLDMVKDYIRSSLFGPKDYFERVKKRLTLIYASLIGVGVVLPAIFAYVAVAFSGTEEGYIVLFRGMVNTAADNPVASAAFLLSNAIVICLFLGANLSYGKLLRRTERQVYEIGALREEVEKWQENKALFISFIQNNDKEGALRIGNHLLSTFPEKMVSDADVLRFSVEADLYDKLHWGEKIKVPTKLLPAP